MESTIPYTQTSMVRDALVHENFGMREMVLLAASFQGENNLRDHTPSSLETFRFTGEGHLSDAVRYKERVMDIWRVMDRSVLPALMEKERAYEWDIRMKQVHGARTGKRAFRLRGELQTWQLKQVRTHKLTPGVCRLLGQILSMEAYTAAHTRDPHTHSTQEIPKPPHAPDEESDELEAYRNARINNIAIELRELQAEIERISGLNVWLDELRQSLPTATQPDNN